MNVNRWLDRVPTQTIDIGWRRVPAFRSIGIMGFHVAVAVAVLVSLRNGLPLATAMGLSTVAAFSFFGWGIARRAITGRESLVLIEHVWIAFGAVSGFLWATGGPIVLGLDVLSVALCPFLLFGRLGCLTVGCCHGIPAGLGVSYPDWTHHPERLLGVRLFPVQLVEAAGLAAIGLVAVTLVDRAPGTATVWFLITYASLRFGTEALRGDRRPAIGPVTVPRLLCVVQASAAVVAAEAWLVPGPPGRATAVAVVTLGGGAAAGTVLTLLRGSNPLVDDEHLDEVWAVIAGLAADIDDFEPAVLETSKGLRVAVSRSGHRLHVSLSHQETSAVPVGLALAPSVIDERNGVTHLSIHRLDAGSAPTRTDPTDEMLLDLGPVAADHHASRDDYFSPAG